MILNDREFSSLLQVTSNSVKGAVLAGLVLGYMVLSIPMELLKELNILPRDGIK